MENRISVVIPSYNSGALIRATLDSILNQSLRPYEVIVVDDGSTDNTVQVLREYDGRITVLTQPNAGVDVARNAGAAKATGDWIAFCDHDDLWLPRKLEKQIALWRENPEIEFVISDYADWMEGKVQERSHLSYLPENYWNTRPSKSGFTVDAIRPPELIKFQPSITSVTLVKRSMLEAIGGWDERVTRNSAEDTCFHFKCLTRSRFGVVPEILMWYRRHPGSLSSDSLKQLRNSAIVWQYIIDEYPAAKQFASEMHEALRNLKIEIVKSAFHQNRFDIFTEVAAKIPAEHLSRDLKIKHLLASYLPTSTGILRKCLDNLRAQLQPLKEPLASA